MTQADRRSDYKLYRSGISPRTSTARRHGNDTKLRLLQLLILVALRTSTTKLNYCRLGYHALSDTSV